MIALSASDSYPADATPDTRKAKALSLLTAINLAWKGAGGKGCTISFADLQLADGGERMILTIETKAGEAAATLDELRAAFKTEA